MTKGKPIRQSDIKKDEYLMKNETPKIRQCIQNMGL